LFLIRIFIRSGRLLIRNGAFAGYQFDFAFDWTTLKDPQIRSGSGESVSTSYSSFHFHL